MSLLGPHFRAREAELQRAVPREVRQFSRVESQALGSGDRTLNLALPFASHCTLG